MKTGSLLTAFMTTLAFATTNAASAITYQYDDLYRLTRVTYDDGSAILYEYDAVGNRTQRLINGDPSSVYLETNVDPPGGGAVTRDPAGPWYLLGTPVSLTAVPEGLCEFDLWAGDMPVGHEADNPVSITVNDYLAVTARFDSPWQDDYQDCNGNGVWDGCEPEQDRNGNQVLDVCECFCGDLDLTGGAVDLGDFATFAVCYGLTAPSPPDCDEAAFACSDLDGSGTVNLSDFATFATWYGLETTQTVPNCGQE